MSVESLVESGKMVREKKSPRYLYKKLGECLGMRV